LGHPKTRFKSCSHNYDITPCHNPNNLPSTVQSFQLPVKLKHPNSIQTEKENRKQTALANQLTINSGAHFNECTHVLETAHLSRMFSLYHDYG